MHFQCINILNGIKMTVNKCNLAAMIICDKYEQYLQRYI